MNEPRVVVVGGGYGGTRVAKLLDDVADVTLVEPKDAFVHSAGALRAAVDPAWEDRVFYPYENLLARGRVVHEYARSVSPHEVRLSVTGAIAADYLVLATGAAYPFPAKFIESAASVARARLARLRLTLAAADRALLVGAGPVGLELAGELSTAFPGLGITIVDRAPDVLTTWDYQPGLRSSVPAHDFRCDSPSRNSLNPRSSGSVRVKSPVAAFSLATTFRTRIWLTSESFFNTLSGAGNGSGSCTSRNCRLPPSSRFWSRTAWAVEPEPAKKSTTRSFVVGDVQSCNTRRSSRVGLTVSMTLSVSS